MISIRQMQAHSIVDVACLVPGSAYFERGVCARYLHYRITPNEIRCNLEQKFRRPLSFCELDSKKMKRISFLPRMGRGAFEAIPVYVKSEHKPKTFLLKRCALNNSSVTVRRWNRMLSFNSSSTPTFNKRSETPATVLNVGSSFRGAERCN